MDKTIKIGTRNVRTLFVAEQLANVKQEMKRLDIDILGTWETRWAGNGQFCSDNLLMFYSVGDYHTNGVGIIMKQCMAKSVIGCWTISDRVMVVKLKGLPVNLNVVQAYAPTSVSTKKELKEFYYQLHQALSVCKPTELQVVMSDFNARIGKESQYPTAGSHALGGRNERADSLVEWCNENNLTIMNTRFENHERRLYTWKSPGGLNKGSDCLYYH